MTLTLSDDTGRESHKVRIVKTDAKNHRWVDIPLGFTRGDAVYLLQTKSMSKRYKRVLPPDLSAFRKQPGPERLPLLDLAPVKKGELNYFPEGLYIGISTVSDAHTVQVLHRVRVILELNSETSYDLIKKDNDPSKPLLPYSKKVVYISLDPFVPEGKISILKKQLAALIEKGYFNFVANNLAHLELLRGKKVNVIAGPYLYIFNRWAASFLENQGVRAFVMPYENSEENLSETFVSPAEKARLLLPVFAYPALFRMRFKLPHDYDFTFFTDKEGMEFKVNSTEDGSFVLPEYPFSILDKADSLKKEGWTHLLIDFSKTKVAKSNMRDLITILQNRTNVQGSSRFNWKDGFFSQEKMDAYKAAAEREKAKEKTSFKGKKKGRR